MVSTAQPLFTKEGADCHMSQTITLCHGMVLKPLVFGFSAQAGRRLFPKWAPSFWIPTLEWWPGVWLMNM